MYIYPDLYAGILTSKLNNSLATQMQIASKPNFTCFRFADTHSCEALKTQAQAHVFRNFPQIVEEEEFLDTPKDILLKFLESEKLKVDSEFQV